MRNAPRRGFSLVEFVVVLAALTVAGTIVAQTATWAIRERLALEERERGRMIAENLLETAKVQPWEGLEAWAAAAKLPEETLARWPRSTLKISVTESHGLKRVDVTIVIAAERSGNARTIVRTGWCAPPAKGGAR